MDPKVEMITLSINAICLMLFTASIGGLLTGIFLVTKYVKRRGFKTKAQKEMTKLAKWIEHYHPELVDSEGTVVDKALVLLAQKPVNNNPIET